MIPHTEALVIIRTKPRRGAGRRWVRPVVLERMRTKQAENVRAMHQVHRAAQHADAVDTVVDLLGAVIVKDA